MHAVQDNRYQQSVLNTIVDSCPLPMWIATPNGAVLRANQAHLHALQLAEEQVVEHYNFFADGNFSGHDIQASIQAVLNRHEQVKFELFWSSRLVEHVDFSGGRDVYMEVSMFPILNPDAELTHVAAQWVDLTETRAAQEALAESKERYHSLFDNSPVPLWEEDFSDVKIYIEGLKARGITEFTRYFENNPQVVAEAARLVKITDINRAALKLHEAETKEQLLAELSSIFTDKSYAAVQAQLIAIAEGQTDYECEASAKTIHGRELETSLKWKVLPGYEDTLRRVHLSSIDVTEQKRAALKLRESEEKFRSLFDQSPIAIQLYDEAGVLVDVNQRTLDLFGVDDKQRLLGYVMWDSPEYTPETIANVKSGHSIYVAADLDFEVVRAAKLFPTTKSGVLHLDTYVFPLTVAGAVIGYTVQMVDVTERRMIEAQLRQAQKMESIGRLAGGIAHDFNNILVPIVGYVEMSMLTMSDEDPAYAGLLRVQKAADRATSLTRQILAFSCKQVLKTQVLCLNDVVADFEDMLQRLIGEDIQLTVQAAESLHQVEVDAGQIEQVLMNLAINARDAMPDGGRLTIETANIHLDEDSFRHHVGDHSPGWYVMLAVTDTGHGMDAEICEQIFEPFFTTKVQGYGTGLGLSTTLGIVEQHGGHIRVHSDPGQGAAFRVYLPKVESAAPVVETTNQDASSLHGTGAILLVEDDVLVRRMVSQALTAFGYKVFETSHPTEALQLAAQHEDVIELLLTDVVMPGMSGVDLYKQIASNNPQLKVLYMSGYTDDAIVHHGVLRDGVQLLQKPFSISRLGQMVKQAIA